MTLRAFQMNLKEQWWLARFWRAWQWGQSYYRIVEGSLFQHKVFIFFSKFCCVSCSHSPWPTCKSCGNLHSGIYKDEIGLLSTRLGDTGGGACLTFKLGVPRWREGIITYKCISHPSNIGCWPPIGLLLNHTKWCGLDYWRGLSILSLCCARM